MSKINKVFETAQKGQHYFNAWVESYISPPAWRSYWWYLTRKKTWPRGIVSPINIPSQASLANETIVTFIGHASLLIQMENLNIITDPVFSESIGPLSWLGVKRSRANGLLINDLPPIHVVLISHNHYDHLDWPSLFALKEKHTFHIFCPIGLEKSFLKRGFKCVTALKWWEHAQLNTHVSVHATPAQHWSQRGLFDKNKSLWLGFYLKSSKNENGVFFPGDTGYGPHFSEINRVLGAPSLSFLPIGAYQPSWLMEFSHMTPEEAVKAHIDLKSEWSLPIHFDTFPLGDELMGQALADLNSACNLRKVEGFKTWANGSVGVLKNGKLSLSSHSFQAPP